MGRRGGEERKGERRKGKEGRRGKKGRGKCKLWPCTAVYLKLFHEIVSLEELVANKSKWLTVSQRLHIKNVKIPSVNFLLIIRKQTHKL